MADGERAQDVVGAHVGARQAHLDVPIRVPLGVLRPVLVALESLWHMYRYFVQRM